MFLSWYLRLPFDFASYFPNVFFSVEFQQNKHEFYELIYNAIGIAIGLSYEEARARLCDSF